MDNTAKINVSDTDKLAIVQEYQAEGPSLDTSQDVTKRIADARGLKVATVRSILVRAGVYVSQPKPRKNVLDEDRAALIAVYNQASALERIDIVWQANVAKQFNYQSIVIWNFFSKQKHDRPTPAPIISKPSQRSTEAQTRHYANVAKELSQSRFEQKLNGEEGWFVNPLWILNTIVVIFLIALVITGIRSIFT